MAELAPPPPPSVVYIGPDGRPTEAFYLWLLQGLLAKVRELESRIADLE